MCDKHLRRFISKCCAIYIYVHVKITMYMYSCERNSDVGSCYPLGITSRRNSEYVSVLTAIIY